MPLLSTNSFGEDPGVGCCNARISRNYLLLVYLLWTIGIFFVAVVVAAVYYLRLTKWLKEQQNANQFESASDTRDIATLTKAIVIVPLLLTSPAATLSAGQMVLPVRI